MNSRATALLVVALAITPAARAQAPAEGDDGARRKKAVAAGLAVLAKAWTPPAAGGKAPAAEPGAGGAGVAVASLSGLALLQSGSTPDDGPHRDAVNQCLDLVLSASRGDGLLAADQSQGPMYGHGFGMLFLAEASLRTNDGKIRDRVRPVLEKAVALSERSQNAEGGWRYQPKPLDADVSVTVGQINGLLAARAAGVAVDGAVLERAADYVKGCQNADGGFSYMAAGPGRGNSVLPRSAAALAALQHAGAAGPAERDRALAYLVKHAPAGRADPLGNSGHVFYAHYYLSQALSAAGGEQGGKASAAFRRELLDRQREDGSWDGDFNRTYATAMALIALQTPDAPLKALGAKKG